MILSPAFEGEAGHPWSPSAVKSRYQTRDRKTSLLRFCLAVFYPQSGLAKPHGLPPQGCREPRCCVRFPWQLAAGTGSQVARWLSLVLAHLLCCWQPPPLLLLASGAFECLLLPPFMSLCVRRPSSSEPIKSVTLSPSGLKSRNSECQGGKVLGTARLSQSLSL